MHSLGDDIPGRSAKISLHGRHRHLLLRSSGCGLRSGYGGGCGMRNRASGGAEGLSHCFNLHFSNDVRRGTTFHVLICDLYTGIPCFSKVYFNASLLLGKIYISTCLLIKRNQKRIFAFTNKGKKQKQRSAFVLQQAITDPAHTISNKSGTKEHDGWVIRSEYA